MTILMFGPLIYSSRWIIYACHVTPPYIKAYSSGHFILGSFAYKSDVFGVTRILQQLNQMNHHPKPLRSTFQKTIMVSVNATLNNQL